MAPGRAAGLAPGFKRAPIPLTHERTNRQNAVHSSTTQMIRKWKPPDPQIARIRVVEQQRPIVLRLDLWPTCDCRLAERKNCLPTAQHPHPSPRLILHHPIAENQYNRMLSRWICGVDLAGPELLGRYVGSGYGVNRAGLGLFGGGQSARHHTTTFCRTAT